MSKDVATSLGDVLQTNTGINTINLAMNRIGAMVAISIAVALKNNTSILAVRDRHISKPVRVISQYSIDHIGHCWHFATHSMVKEMRSPENIDVVARSRLSKESMPDPQVLRSNSLKNY